jgi:hypothetical protein
MFSHTAVPKAAAIPAASVQAVVRHHSQRRITGSPSPTPSEMLNFQAHSILPIREATSSEPSVINTTPIRHAATNSRLPASGRIKRA